MHTIEQATRCCRCGMCGLKTEVELRKCSEVEAPIKRPYRPNPSTVSQVLTVRPSEDVHLAIGPDMCMKFKGLINTR
jgi:hypothetical protein